MKRLSGHDFFEDNEFPFHADTYRVRDHGQIQPHSHDFVEFVYIAQGNGEHEYHGRTHRITEGDVFMIEPEAVHAYKTGAAPLLVYNILISSTLLVEELRAMDRVTPFIDFYYLEPFMRKSTSFQSHLNLDYLQRMELTFLLDRIVKEYKEKKLGHRILIKMRLIEMFIFLSRCYESYVNKPLAALPTDAEVIAKIGDFIRQHYDKPLTLLQVSQLCGMSQSTFTARFKQHTGRTFIEFRNDIRLQEAKKLLADSEDKIIAIAHKVGFDDLSFFNRLFKQQEGRSPGQFRAQIRNKRM
ncbi:MAG: hypothetical protein K0R75_684 [Paenibacillaceae bacterium]|nr:hypothetical protein [Paenibacillaceae bacterium]